MAETNDPDQLDPKFGTFPLDHAFRAEYGADRQRLESMGVSLRDYIVSRRIDEGLVELTPRGVADGL